jgi:hypothetical protein
MFRSEQEELREGPEDSVLDTQLALCAVRGPFMSRQRPQSLEKRTV